MKRAAMLWTGGKDSALALRVAREQGYDVGLLVTFAPEQGDFHAHPLPLIDQQAKALGLPWRCVAITAPYEESYRKALAGLVEEGWQVVITGDIAEVDGHPNWIRERAEGLVLEVVTPLWDCQRDELVERVLAEGIKAVISCVKVAALSSDWVGRELDAEALADLRLLHREKGVDLAGENGEYHTIVVDSPDFAWPLELPDFLLGGAGGLAWAEWRFG